MAETDILATQAPAAAVPAADAPASVSSSSLIGELGKLFDGGLTGNVILDFKLIGDFTIGNLLAVILITILVIVASRVVSRLLRRGLSGKVDAKNIDGLVKLVCWIIFFIGLLIASPQLHIDLSGLLVAGGVVGVAVGFASQNTLSNFIAGILLMIERPIGIGDEINIADSEGYVESISLLSTKIKTYDGDILRIPNSTVFSANITNLVTNVARRFTYSIDIRYTDDADTAVKIIRETALQNPYILTEPAPSIYVNELGAHGINILVKLWSPSQYWWDAKIEVLWTLFKALRKGGIDIPFNQLTLWYGEDDAAKLQNNLDTDKSAAEIIGHKKEERMLYEKQ
ncbi:MAG: mechanosensitive ion channel family protein [Methanocorpusculum sp.]|nr:mechanosensitive ion channel family protein [Methanocorpusculum sp.]